MLRNLAATFLALIFAAETQAACVSDVEALVAGKNKFVCPLTLIPPLMTAGTVRGGDACASQGGAWIRTEAQEISTTHSTLMRQKGLRLLPPNRDSSQCHETGIPTARARTWAKS